MTSPGAEKPFADAAKTESIARGMGGLQVKKWLEKLDPKADLDKFGLKTPTATVTLTLKKNILTPSAAVLMLGTAATPEQRALLMVSAAASGRQADKGETSVIRFGKETDQDKDKPGTFAQLDGKDLLFLVPNELVQMFTKIDLRDRSPYANFAALLEAGSIGAGPSAWPTRLPLLARTVQTFDPAKVKEIKLEVRTTAELRRFHFVRDAKDPKVWQDQSNLLEFQPNAEKINSLLDNMSKLQADRWAAFGTAPRPELKFDPKEATLKVDLLLEGGKTITVTVGDTFDQHGYFAQTTEWPGVVFLLSHARVAPYLSGTAYFGKQRLTAAN